MKTRVRLIDNELNMSDTNNEQRALDRSAIARLENRNFEYMIRLNCVVVGRNNSAGLVDVHVGHSNFVSRSHIYITYEHPDFFLMCHNKNGVFVDGTFRRKSETLLRLPKQCLMRFLSIETLLMFNLLIDKTAPPPVLENTFVQNQTGATATPWSRNFAGIISATDSPPTSTVGNHRSTLGPNLQMAAAVTNPGQVAAPMSSNTYVEDNKHLVLSYQDNKDKKTNPSYATDFMLTLLVNSFLTIFIVTILQLLGRKILVSLILSFKIYYHQYITAIVIIILNTNHHICILNSFFKQYLQPTIVSLF